jgi:hypothetical protein
LIRPDLTSYRVNLSSRNLVTIIGALGTSVVGLIESDGASISTGEIGTCAVRILI